MDINKKARELADEIMGKQIICEGLEESIAENGLTKNACITDKYKGALALTIGACMGIGFVNYAIQAKVQEENYYYTEPKIIVEDTTYELDPDYQEKLKIGEEVLLLEYGPWEEVKTNNPYTEYATSYKSNLYAYPVGDEFLSYEEYLDIDTSNLEGEVVDTKTTYVAPTEADERFLYVRSQNLDDSIMVADIDNLTTTEKAIFCIVSILTIVGASYSIGNFAGKWINNYISMPSFIREQLLEELELLEASYKVNKKELVDALKDLTNLFNKYEQDITDEETKEICRRLVRG